MTRRLVSSAEARPAKKQHTTPCSDCPWTRKSVPGWLGPLTAEEWIQLAHNEGEPGCHCTTNMACAGLAIYRANVCKSPRDPAALRLPADTVKVFSWHTEFTAHHGALK